MENIKEAVEICKVIDSNFDKKNYPVQYKALQTLLSLAQLFLSVSEKMPKKLLEEDIKVECPVKDGKYWKILIEGQVVALVPTKELAIELVRKCFSRNQAIDEFTAWLAGRVNVERIQEIILNNILKYDKGQELNVLGAAQAIKTMIMEE